MTSPSALKAAGNKDAATRAVDRLIEQKLLDPEQRYNIGQVIRVEYEADIKAAITEAVDAAVAPKEKRVKELEAALEALKHRCQLYEDAIEEATTALEAPHEP